MHNMEKANNTVLKHSYFTTLTESFLFINMIELPSIPANKSKVKAATQ